jgi:hypothetical protein
MYACACTFVCNVCMCNIDLIPRSFRIRLYSCMTRLRYTMYYIWDWPFLGLTGQPAVVIELIRIFGSPSLQLQPLATCKINQNTLTVLLLCVARQLLPRRVRRLPLISSFRIIFWITPLDGVAIRRRFLKAEWHSMNKPVNQHTRMTKALSEAVHIGRPHKTCNHRRKYKDPLRQTPCQLSKVHNIAEFRTYSYCWVIYNCWYGTSSELTCVVY